MTDVENLAREFSRVLKQWLSPENNDGVDLFKEMLQEHTEDNYANEPFCVSHDYCDANMAIAEAFKNVLGREHEGMNDEDNAIWNESWSLAKQNNFYA